MATIYIFNENIITRTGTPGHIININIAGYDVNATVGADGRASVNASPYYRAMFANIDRNTEEAFTTEIALDEEDALKYGYLDIDESGEYSNLSYVPANQKDTKPRACQRKVRWLDHYGNWRYYCFETGSTSVTDAQKGEMLPGYFGHVATSEFLRPQIKSSVESITLCAPKVDETTFQYLCELKRSIHVCIEGVNEWIPVVVSSGTNTWVRDAKRKKKQDFEITLNYPERQISL